MGEGMKQPRLWLVVFFLFVFGMWVSSLLNFQSLAQPVFRGGNQLVETWRFREMDTAVSMHFMMMYPTELEREAQALLDVAERVYNDFARKNASVSDKPIPLVLFSEQTDMQERFGWEHARSATGVYYGGVIYLLSSEDWPNADVPPLDEETAWKQYVYAQGPLAHELAHYYLDQVANGNFPRWFTEAFAQWVEYELLGYEWLVPHNVLYEASLYSYDELRHSFDQLENQALAYRQSFMFYRYMLEAYGSEKMDELHAQIADRVPFSRAWQAVYDTDERQLFKEWKTKVTQESIR